MITTVTCTNVDCANADIEYRLVDVTDPVLCGGCGVFIDPVVTDEPSPDFSEALVLSTQEQSLAKEEAKQSALQKLTALGLTEEEIQALIGF